MEYLVVMTVGMALGFLLTISGQTLWEETKKTRRSRLCPTEVARLTALRTAYHEKSVRSTDPSFKHIRFPNT